VDAARQQLDRQTIDDMKTKYIAKGSCPSTLSLIAK